MILNSDKNEIIKEKNEGNSAMADAMRRVLSMGKNSTKSSLVLAKAKTITKPQIVKRQDNVGFEIEKSAATADNVGDVTNIEDDAKPDVKPLKRKRIKKLDVSSIGRVKPSPLDREKERPLSKIATRGVVQLFNAVREQQKMISRKIAEVGPSEHKKEKVLKSIDKQAFLDVLLGNSHATTSKNAETVESEVKTENEEEEEEEDKSRDEPSWSVLRDDFMMGAKLKDWDKEESSPSLAPAPKRSKNK